MQVQVQVTFRSAFYCCNLMGVEEGICSHACLVGQEGCSSSSSRKPCPKEDKHNCSTTDIQGDMEVNVKLVLITRFYE